MVRLSIDDGATELVGSLLWDAGTTGIVEIDDGLMAGFADREMAEALVERAANWPASVTAVEPDRWAGTDEITTVTVGADGRSGRPGGRTLSIAAGPTFGHGGHPTTTLAIELLTAAVLERTTADRVAPAVLDVGTGSGVLAIAAAALGAHPVVGVDIDPAAIVVARANADNNRVDVVLADVAVEDSPSLVGGRPFDVIVANVLAPVHRELAPAVAAVLAPAGSLVTTGYLARDGSAVIEGHRSAIEATAPGRITGSRERARDGWLAHRLTIGAAS